MSPKAWRPRGWRELTYGYAGEEGFDKRRFSCKEVEDVMVAREID